MVDPPLVKEWLQRVTIEATTAVTASTTAMAATEAPRGAKGELQSVGRERAGSH